MKVLTFIITSITSCHTGFAAILVIMCLDLQNCHYSIYILTFCVEVDGVDGSFLTVTFVELKKGD